MTTTMITETMINLVFLHDDKFCCQENEMKAEDRYQFISKSIHSRSHENTLSMSNPCTQAKNSSRKIKVTMTMTMTQNNQVAVSILFL